MAKENTVTVDSIPDYEFRFESLGELLTFLEKPSINGKSQCSSECTDDTGWYGTASMADAKRLAVTGWVEGTAMMEKFSSMMIDKITSLVVRDEYFYDVTGYDFDLARGLQGVPECWLNSDTVEVTSPSVSNVRLLVNVGASGGVSSEALMIKGAAIGALVMLLEQSRRSVEVEVVWRSNCWRGVRVPKLVETRLLVKKTGDSLDLGKLAFVLAHPSFLRRFGFGVMERIKDESINTVCRLCGGYGSVEPVKSDADIYVPGSSLDAMGNYSGIAGAEKWIIEKLKAQGVELTKGEE